MGDELCSYDLLTVYGHPWSSSESLINNDVMTAGDRDFGKVSRSFLFLQRKIRRKYTVKNDTIHQALRAASRLKL